MSEKELHTLKLLQKLTSVQQQKLRENCDTDFLIFCFECALNVINGTVEINLKNLHPYEKLLCRKSNINQETQKNFDVVRRSEINELDKSSLFLLFDRLIFMNTH